jgi:hypothetical protein
MHGVGQYQRKVLSRFFMTIISHFMLLRVLTMDTQQVGFLYAPTLDMTLQPNLVVKCELLWPGCPEK